MTASSAFELDACEAILAKMMSNTSMVDTSPIQYPVHIVSHTSHYALNLSYAASPNWKGVS